MFKYNTITIAALALTGALGGCQSYAERNDGVTSFAGDSNAVNEAKMVDDPWKRNAYNDHLHGDSERLGDAVRRYQTANSSEGEGGLVLSGGGTSQTQ